MVVVNMSIAREPDAPRRVNLRRAWNVKNVPAFARGQFGERLVSGVISAVRSRDYDVEDGRDGDSYSSA
jgi:hypothetical protein